MSDGRDVRVAATPPLPHHGLAQKRERIPTAQMIRSAVLPNFARIRELRKHGPVGNGFVLGRGAVIASDSLRIGENVEIGPGTVIRARHLEIGDNTSIGALGYLDVPDLRIGNWVKIREQVYVGGMTFPDSSLRIGNHVTIFQFTVLNPTRPILIGDGVGIGGNCSIFTHGSWQSIFKGFPVKFGPVTIEKDAWLPWNVFVMPGVTIGARATLGACSVVTNDIPASSLAIGFPARVVKEATAYPPRPSPSEMPEILRSIIKEFVPYCAFVGAVITERWEDDKRGELVTQNPTEGRLIIDLGPVTASGAQGSAAGMTVRVFLGALNDGLAEAWVGKRPFICPDLELLSEPLGALGEEFVEFLERYGVRFPR